MGAKLNTDDVIKYSAYETLNNGYIKRSEAESMHELCTAERVFDAITKDEVEDSELEKVRDRVIAWAEYINEQSGEYFENVKEEIGKPTIDEMKIGLIASSFSSFDKFAKYAKMTKDDKDSNFLGDEGDHITFNIKDHRLVKTGMSKFGNGQGSKWYLYSIHDTNGNVITYFANHDSEFEFQHSNIISATVSKQTVYNGVKQTSISRVKFE